jgi:hypothetical protein
MYVCVYAYIAQPSPAQHTASIYQWEINIIYCLQTYAHVYIYISIYVRSLYTLVAVYIRRI